MDCAYCTKEVIGAANVVGSEVFHPACYSIEMNARRDAELARLYPRVPPEIMGRLKLHRDSIEALKFTYVIIYSNEDRDYFARGYDTLEEVKEEVTAYAYGSEQGETVDSVYHNSVPMKFKVEHTVKVTIEE